MAKQIEGVSERILAAAQAEFPDKGYMKASLRAIAAADTGANSIYVCFGDKEGLFSAIAEPVLSGMTERFLKLQEAFRRLDAFRLLPDASSGTRCHRTGFRAVFGSRTEARHAAGNGSFPSDRQLAKPNSRGEDSPMEKQSPVQQGRHEELIAQSGVYADFAGGKRETTGWKL